MIFYRMELLLDSEPGMKADEIEKMSSWQKEEWLGAYNTGLLDAYEEGAVSVLLQLAAIDTPKEILAYAAYDQNSLLKGFIDAENDISDAVKYIKFPVDIGQIAQEEVSATDYVRALDRHGLRTSRLRDITTRKFGADFSKYDTYGYKLEDRMADGEEIRDRESAKNEVQKLLPDAAMIKEVDRIFSKKHPRDLFYGIPVHYKLSVKSDVAADDMVDLLVKCLYVNKRILSRRITKIFDIEDKRWDKENFSKLMKCSQGSVVQIMLNGDVASESEYASRYHQVSDVLAEYVKKDSGSIQFFFVENTAHPGFARQLLGKIDEELDILEINEGAGSAKQAQVYFEELLKKSNMQQYFGDEAVFQGEKYYSATEVRAEFNKWRKNRLKDRVYSMYDQDIALRIEKDVKKKGSAYEELHSMAGLKNVKEIISDIIAAYKISRLRNEYYDSNDKQTRHMIFTGNPGTAKTTVARLLAEILKENGILKTGAFIECGRADLVGKYVGWTANIVKEKFSQAQGGILFIDEAYSLVEDRAGLYGDEAINTIVQEMENKRGDVIVIFAGYPEKMERFLERNEGLRSRIAFHVDFPDYEPEELMEILHKILCDKQYTMTKEAEGKAADIFKAVYRQKEYGNGRFVRNLFEQAVNRQASRISSMTDGKIDREMLFELNAADFDTNTAAQYGKKEKMRFGF